MLHGSKCWLILGKECQENKLNITRMRMLAWIDGCVTRPDKKDEECVLEKL